MHKARIKDSYFCALQRLPLPPLPPPLCPVGLGLADVAATGAGAKGVLTLATGATGAALLTGAEATGGILLETEETTGATGTTAEVAIVAIDEPATGETIDEVTAAAVVATTPETTVPTAGGTRDEATPVDDPVTSQAWGTVYA
jgi:hypothetical protein